MPAYSTGDLLTAINLAILDRNFEAAVDILKVLAVQDPHAAQAVLDTIELAKALSS